jgi:hypothetical protein
MLLYLMFTLRCRQADFVASVSGGVVNSVFYLLLVSLLLAFNYPRCRCYQLITGVMESMKIWNKAQSLMSTRQAINYV